jgi:glycosyltransferase involved in cell wall biosynthesis
MPLKGGIDLLDRHGVQGWVQETDDPDNPVSLLVRVDGQVTTRTLANLYRFDLENAGIGNGRYGFALKLEGISPIEPHSIELVREADDAPVPGTPRAIPRSPELNDALQDHLVELLSHAESDATFKRWAAFLAQQADRLLQRRADVASNKPHPTAPREFRVRWSGRGPAPDPDPAPRALVIDESLPVANRDAGSQAMMSHMRSLQRLGFKVVLAPSDMKGGPAADALEAAGIRCCCTPWCASVEEVLRRENGGFALIYVHRGTNTRYLSLIRHYQPRARIVYSVADLHHVRLARQAEVEERPELLEASARVRAVEMAAARFVDGVITHSSYEQAIIKRDVPNARVHLIPWSIETRPTRRPWMERRGLAFIGNYRHPPNLDAAWWLIQDVMPLVRAQNPAIECVLAGSNMPEALQAAIAPGVRSVGFVDDLAGLFDEIRLTAAPLNFGAGLKGKVLESLAAGLPCACTPVAAEGMDFPATLQSMVGIGERGLADVILRLHDDEALNAACSQAGLDYVVANMSDARVDAAMREAAGLTT